MNRIHDLFILLRSGNRQNRGVRFGDRPGFRAETSCDNDLSVLAQSLANRIQAFSFCGVQKPARIHNHRIRTVVIG